MARPSSRFPIAATHHLFAALLHLARRWLLPPSPSPCSSGNYQICRIPHPSIPLATHISLPGATTHAETKCPTIPTTSVTRSCSLTPSSSSPAGSVAPGIWRSPATPSPWLGFRLRCHLHRRRISGGSSLSHTAPPHALSAAWMAGAPSLVRSRMLGWTTATPTSSAASPARPCILPRPPLLRDGGGRLAMRPLHRQ